MSLYRRMRARGLLVPIAATGLLIVIATGGALASRAPSLPTNEAPRAQDPSEPPGVEEQEAPPTEEELAEVVDRLAAAGVATNAATVGALAAEHGIGGAVRLLAWADASGQSVDQIAAMRAGDEDTAPMGWGRIARELNAANPDLDLHPGIGKIMGGGHGRDDAPGQTGD